MNGMEQTTSEPSTTSAQPVADPAAEQPAEEEDDSEMRAAFARYDTVSLVVRRREL